MGYRIAIVNSSSFGQIFTEHLDQLETIGPVDRFRFPTDIDGRSLANKLTGYNIIIASVTPQFNQEFFDNKDELLLISRHGIGFNNIDLQAAKAHHTTVTIVSPLVERDAVAENNVANLLSLMRRTTASNQATHDGRWRDRAKFLGNNLADKTVGVIGVGNIGGRLVEIMHYGFRAHVLGTDPNQSSSAIKRYGGHKVPLPELLMQSDVILLAASLGQNDFHLLNQAAIDLMKSGVYISNAARGALVDETAIINGLKSCKIAGYATDVLEHEPGTADHPFMKLPNVIVTPHTSAYTMECLEQMGTKCVSDVFDIVHGRLPANTVVSASLAGAGISSAS